MPVYKSIAFAYPTSLRAAELGAYKTGAWFVELCGENEAGQFWTAVAQGHDSFATPDDPELIALFLETDGAISGAFLRHGNELARRAVMSAISTGSLS